MKAAILLLLSCVICTNGQSVVISSTSTQQSRAPRSTRTAHHHKQVARKSQSVKGIARTAFLWVIAQTVTPNQANATDASTCFSCFKKGSINSATGEATVICTASLSDCDDGASCSSDDSGTCSTMASSGGVQACTLSSADCSYCFAMPGAPPWATAITTNPTYMLIAIIVVAVLALALVVGLPVLIAFCCCGAACCGARAANRGKNRVVPVPMNEAGPEPPKRQDTVTVIHVHHQAGDSQSEIPGQIPTTDPYEDAKTLEEGQG